MLPEHPHTNASSSPEGEVRYEERNIVRVIALHTALVQKEMLQEMLPTAETIQRLSEKNVSSEVAVRILSTIATQMPFCTRLIMEFKGGTTSNNRIMLPGGGIDTPNFNQDDIISEGLRELKTETGHTSNKSLLRGDCNRTYHFTMQKGSTTIRRTNHEFLMVAYIPRQQNTDRRFLENENIMATIRLTPQQLSMLLQEESYMSKQHTGVLIDNLCLNPENYVQNTVIVDADETVRTRMAIEDEVWTYEAYSWKKLLSALQDSTASKIPESLKHSISSILNTSEFHSHESAKDLIARIHRVLVTIEKSYPMALKPKKQRLSKTSFHSLIQTGVAKRDIQNRMILMDELEEAYKIAFHAQKKRPSGR